MRLNFTWIELSIGKIAEFGQQSNQIFPGKALHSSKVNVWCRIWAKSVIGPYFIEYAAGKLLTVNGERYRHMIETFLKPYLNDFGVESGWLNRNDEKTNQFGKYFV